MSDNPKSGNLLSEFKLRLTAEPLDGAIERNGRRQEPQLTISVYDNQPRFTVYTNVEGDKQNGKIEGNMDSFTFYAVMQAIRDVVADPDSPGYAIENKGHFFSKENGRSEKPGVKSRTVIGRNERGEIFIGVIANNRPKAQFFFRPSEYHTFINKDGTPTSPAKVSEVYAKSYARLMEQAVMQVLASEYISYDQIKARKEANRGGGGGGGGYNRGGGQGGYNRGNGNQGGYNRGGGQGGYNKKPEPAAEPASYDDDMPF